jgi:2,4-dienoyl-CoA reductase-like NADH-dependent reductase (Old Yellow Enzyme family)/thioredoxin reductase
MKPLKHLFMPIQIGKIEVKNRIVMPPMATNLCNPNGEVTQKQIDHFVARAKGGVGLIIIEDTTIGPNYVQNTTSLADDRVIPGWKNLTKAIHAHSVKVMPQIFHPAFNAPSALNNGAQPVSASPIPNRITREIPRELTIHEIQDIIKDFGKAALRAKEGGCDGIQIHCAHMHHLLGSFLSPYYNKRSDEYGGSLENRVRLPLEVIRHIRSKVGPDFTILIRISGDEYLPGGLTLKETTHIAPLLVEAGVDAIHVSAATSTNAWVAIPPTGWPQAPNAPLAAEIKKTVKVPVIVVGRITEPWVAEDVIASGKADMVAIGRALLADPEWPNKVAKGEWKDIAPCVGDTMCLITVSALGQPVNCLINACAGRDAEMALILAQQPKQVLVVGGGPGGLEAARVSALRGHKVTLMEKSSKLGGQFNMASFPPMKNEYIYAIQYLVAQVNKAGVRVELNQEATPELIKKQKPDVVIIATGGLPVIPSDIPGLNAGHVITAWDVLTGRVFPGPNVVIVGGGKVGCETADYIAHIVDDFQPGGNRVTILEMLENVILDDWTPWRTVLIQRLKAKGVEFIPGAKVSEILPEGVKYIKGGREEILQNVNHIVLAMGTKSNNSLMETLKGSGMTTFVIGDAKEPRKALEAIAEGSEIARKI